VVWLPGGKALLGKAAYGLGCAAAAIVLGVSGIGYYAQTTAESLGTSRVLAGGPPTGPMNILIMGLESRTYWDGTPIDHHLQYTLHLGSIGGEETNTLILMHVFAGGQKAVAFSIPRDDYVTLYGTLGYSGTPAQNKVDDAYNAGMQQELINDRTKHPNWTSAQDNLDANQAGQQAEVDTVEALTGVTINKFAELNLIGFYELANAFGGVEACINSWPGGDSVPPGGNLSDPVTYNSDEGQDAGSGFKGRAGLQHLTPVQTLEFVRQRHDLPEGDIDRTERQQAVLDDVLFQLKSDGMLSDVSKLSSLMSVAKNYLQTSAGWNLLQFAGEMNALTPENMKFYTLPSTPGPDVPGIGSVNDVNVAQIQAQVQHAFNAPQDGITAPVPSSGAKSSTSTKAPAKPAATVPPASDVTVDVYNSSQTPGLAGNLLAALVKKGYRAGSKQEYPSPLPLTTVSYGAGAAAKAHAEQIAKDFDLTATASSSVAAGHVQVILGGSVTFLPSSLGGQSTATPSATPSSTSTANTGNTGNTGNSDVNSARTSLGKEAKAKYGIPCVY
jgi:anionic cell wall polymer biosynthesis LytR-Cps2A-Psr (LCP) family protein